MPILFGVSVSSMWRTLLSIRLGVFVSSASLGSSFPCSAVCVLGADVLKFCGFCLEKTVRSKSISSILESEGKFSSPFRASIILTKGRIVRLVYFKKKTKILDQKANLAHHFVLQLP
jgi:hypothetical protein